MSVWTTASEDTRPGGGKPRRTECRWRLYFVVVLINIISFTTGIVYGWSAVVLPLLQSENSPVGIPPITDSEASWLASIYCLSRPLTIPFYMYCNDHLGRKLTGYLVAAPYIVGHSMLLFANSGSMLFWARFITGLATGGASILVPSFTSDIAEDDIKGKLGIVFGLSLDSGMCFAYVMVYLTSYQVFHICCVLLPVAFVFVVWWLPESPLFLMTTDKVDEARDSLNWFRNGLGNDFELERMKTRAEEVLEKRNQKISISELKKVSTMRGFLICTGLIINKSLNGYVPISSFTVKIFQDAGSTLSPYIATILLGFVEISGSLLTVLIIEKSGRRSILITSNVVIAFCMAVLGTYFYLQSLGWNLEVVGWLPVVILAMFMASNGMGVGPIPLIMPTELMHNHYQTAMQSSNMVLMSILQFVTTLLYTPLAGVIGYYGCFWLFACLCTIAALCVFFTVPETKNRSTEEILEHLSRRNFIRSVISYKENKTAMKSFASKPT